jgi:hypothetical protein
MGMFEMSDEQVGQYREQMRGYAREKVAEPVVAAAMFRRGGAGAKMAVSHAGLGAIVYGAIALFQKKQAGGLPDKALLVATPTKVHAFKVKPKGRGWNVGDEVAVWDRAGLRASTQPKMGLTMLTVESPTEGEKVTIAPIGVKDDPVSLEFMKVLTDGVTAAPAAA